MLLSQLFAEFHPDLRISTSTFYKFRDYKNLLSKYSDTSELTWSILCDIANQSGLYKESLIMLTLMLKYGLLKDSADYYLDEKLEFFEDMTQTNASAYREIFSYENVKDLVIIRIPEELLSRESGRFYYYKMPYKNPLIREIVKDMLSHKGSFKWHYYQKDIIKEFEKTFSGLEDQILGLSDFGEMTFWHQINNIRNSPSLSASEKKNWYKTIVNFYRNLDMMYPEQKYFSDSATMSRSLLYSNKITIYIENGYYFTTYNPDKKEEILKHSKIIFFFRGYDHLSTRISPDVYNPVDLSGIQTELYRREILSYYLSFPSPSFVLFPSLLRHLMDGISQLESLKKSDNYPSPEVNRCTVKEAIYLKSYLNKKNRALRTNNNAVGMIRRFFLWEKEFQHNISIEPLALDYLVQYEEPSKTGGTSIPQDDLLKIIKIFKRKAEENDENFIQYVMFQLLLVTEFRIGQICNLRKSCLVPTAKKDQYEIRSQTKTSNGRKTHSIITEDTKNLLMDAIGRTEQFREELSQSRHSDYIFLYRSRLGQARPILIEKFRDYLQKCCEEAGTKSYNCTDLRDTYMTRAFEFCIRNGKSDIEMGILSKHKHIDTTKNHYIEIELEKMLESTYGIIIGDTEKLAGAPNVVDSIPSEFSNSSSTVHYGCGICTSDHCVNASMLPCLICSKFITTVDHEAFFLKALEMVDQRLDAAKTPHDKEDLSTIKKLYVLYLEAIYQKKEG